VIITLGTPPTVAAMQATKHIPIVMAFVGDPVEKGLIASLNRPGGNVTGMATLIAYPKLWQFLHETSRSTRRVAVVSHEQNRGVLGDREAAFREFAIKRWKDAAAAIGVDYFP
jgi:putative ABC transport system substrate-binding protein